MNEFEKAIQEGYERLDTITKIVNELPLEGWFKAKVLDFIVEYECAEDESNKYTKIEYVEYEGGKDVV